ncbi:MAG: hypothetical protein PUK66_01775 [Bacteroidales bacterium]|uniref:hypothetical protein n=1 Tax=Porphyromonas sp. TaxID=1924944 RepID=UPI002978C2F3|nr:hypothetical protein [Porphyromonas sp.]MDD7437558.1 hypothetical protein [Bacteroidales bacterium]MDY3066325.1 hypothetical protein [Porphyromonas sp.]
MALNQKSNKRILANGFAILAVALAMWLFANRNNREDATSVDASILKIAVDLSPNGLQVDSLGNLSGKQKELLDLLLPRQQKELVPFTNRTEALSALTAGEVQLYATSMPYSSASNLDNSIIATEWLYASHFSLLFNERNADWVNQFSGDSISTVVVSKEDQVAVTILKNLSELTYPSLRIEVRDEPPLQLGVELSKGQITYLMCDSDIAESIVRIDSTLMLSHDVGFDLHQVWLVNSAQDSLRLALDSTIIALRGSKEWIRIINSNK